MSGKIKFDPIVKLASHEDTFGIGKLFPVKCRMEEYETIEKSCKGKNPSHRRIFTKTQNII